MAKLTTAEILAKARQQAGAAPTGADAPPPAETPADVPAGSEAVSSSEVTKPTAKPKAASSAPGPRPTSTADILAKARAEAAGGSAGASEPEAKPTAKEPAEKKPAAKKPAPSKPAAGGAPKSTKDILAAARAQAAGGTAESTASDAPATAAAKPAAKTAPKAKPSVAAAGDRPSVQEMLKRARGESPAAAPAETEAKPTLPPRPQRPAPAKVRPEADQRRGFLATVGGGLAALVATPFAAGWTAFTTASIAATLGLARFMMPNVMVEPPSKFKIGSPDDYPIGTVTTKWKSEYAIWITHQIYNQKAEIYALSTVCTHLGCTPNWLEGEQKFKCPCHGSGFYATGINFEGPAPRPLERYAITIASDGMLEVDKSQKFQEELGQWNDPASFVATG